MKKKATGGHEKGCKIPCEKGFDVEYKTGLSSKKTKKGYEIGHRNYKTGRKKTNNKT